MRYAGQRATADDYNDLASLSAIKLSDSLPVTNSTALVADDDLVLTLPAGGSYKFDAWLAVVSTNASGSGDVKVGFTWSGATASWGGNGNSVAVTPTGNITAVRTSSGQSVAFGVGTVVVSAWISGTLIAGTSDVTLQLEFAQNTASSGNSVTLKALSRLWAQQSE